MQIASLTTTFKLQSITELKYNNPATKSTVLSKSEQILGYDTNRFWRKKNQPISCINCKFVQALHSQFIALCINIIIKLSLNGLPISFVTIQKPLIF